MIVGKIYFVSAPGRIKIGYTRQPEKRLASLQAVDMEALTTLGIIPGTRDLEKTLHGRASPYRIRGEWFVDCDAVRALVADAVAGKFPVEAAEELTPVAVNRPAQIDVLNSAIGKSFNLAEEIKERARRHENISDLVRSACFLGEHVIARILGGLAPEIKGDS